MTTYMSGSLVRSTATFTNQSGPADPDTITLKYRKGSGSVTTLTYAGNQVTRDGTGVYHVDLDTSGFTGPDAQTWALEWIGTGTCQAITTDSFKVSPPLF